MILRRRRAARARARWPRGARRRTRAPVAWTGARCGSPPGRDPARHRPSRRGWRGADSVGTVWLEPVNEVEGFWLELGGLPEGELPAAAARVLPLVGALLGAERQRAFLAEELTSRYEEIDLLYAISEILGQTVRLDEATQTIAREVSTCVARAAPRSWCSTRAPACCARWPRGASGWTGWRRSGGRRLLGSRAGLPRAARPGIRPTQTGRRPVRLRRGPRLQGPGLLSRGHLLRARRARRSGASADQPDRSPGGRPVHADRPQVVTAGPTRSGAVENARLVERDLAQQRSARSSSSRTTSSSSCSLAKRALG